VAKYPTPIWQRCAAGFSDANIVEIIALSAQYMLTNFVNNVFDTEIDFPVVDLEVK
jgi:alkylhydroperoxidase family enzyme